MQHLMCNNCCKCYSSTNKTFIILCQLINKIIISFVHFRQSQREILRWNLSFPKIYNGNTFETLVAPTSLNNINQNVQNRSNQKWPTRIKPCPIRTYHWICRRSQEAIIVDPMNLFVSNLWILPIHHHSFVPTWILHVFNPLIPTCWSI